jgi:two-component system, NtrC family, response regulator AtoC
MKSILIVEDERKLREGLATLVTSAGYGALAAPGLAEARALVENEEIACVLLDIRLKDGDGLTFLRWLRAGPRRDVPVIVATAYGDSERTIEAMRDGAFEYVTKPFDLDRLLQIIERALKQYDVTRTPTVQPAPSTRGGLVGTSEAMLGVWKVIGRAASSDASVLITGETGTGKELVARAIHQYSARAAEPFVAVNLAALPASLIESELMGHEKGAFTGATAQRAGRLELAGKGTLLLDEIGDLDVSLQTKLLRVLQDGTFERVGGEAPMTSRARIIAATNKPVRPGEPGAALREDLYYRLGVIEIVVPPLRERRSDIPLLVAHALEGTRARAVTEEAMSRLMEHAWPGNVRELAHVISRAAVMCGGEVIDLVALPPNVAAPSPPARGDTPSDTPSDVRSDTPNLREAMAAFERRLILAALEQCAGNRSEAARRLGIARTHLYAKMQEHGIPAK